MFTTEAKRLKVDDKTIDEIGHILLSHHGIRDWGSTTEPQTIDALIVHCADNLSAKFGQLSYTKWNQKE